MKKIIKLIKLVLLHFVYCFGILAFDSWVLKKKLPEKTKKLLLVKLDGIGDYVLFRNFLEIIRNSEKYKNYQITLCGNVLWKDIAENFDTKYVDDFLWINREKFVKDFIYRKSVLKKIRNYGFEIAIQPTYSREFLLGDSIMRASGARERIGSSGDLSNMTFLQKKISDKFYTKLLPASRVCIFEFYRNREFIGSLLDDSIFLQHITFDVKNAEFVKSERYIVVMPGAGAEFRRWKYEKFAEVVNHIVKKYDIKKVFIAGGKQDFILGEGIAKIVKDIEVSIVAGKQPLNEFVNLVSGASLLLTNETGAAHIAVATGTKTICISNGNHYGRFNPYPNEISEDVALVYPKEIYEKKDDFEFLCKTYGHGSAIDLNTIQVAEVIKEVDKIW